MERVSLKCLYIIDTPEKGLSVENCNNGCIQYWHPVLYHYNEASIMILKKENVTEGMNIVSCSKSITPSKICLQGKLGRNAFPKESFGRHSDACAI